MTYEFKELLEIKDVLLLFKCNENTFRTWITKKQLPEKLIVEIGNTKRIRSAILEKYLNGEL